MPPSLIKTEDFDVKLIPSSRRVRISLKVSSKGVFLHIPTQLPMEFVHNLIDEKSDWIKQQLAKQPKPEPERQWQNRDSLSLFGQSYELQLEQKGDIPSVTLINNAIVLSGRLHRIGLKTRKQAIVNWYKELADIYLNKRTEEFSKKTGLIPKSITIKTYKARWGSCNIKGEIQYNWQIMQAAPSVIDYLIIHELCHLKHHNHGKGFWQLVERHCPHYRREQVWLKQYGYQLSF